MAQAWSPVPPRILEGSRAGSLMGQFWPPVAGDAQTLVLASGWTQDTPPLRLFRRFGLVILQGGAVRNSWGAYATVCTIPAGMRPSGTIPIEGHAQSNGSPVAAYYDTATGQINMYTAGGAGAGGVRLLAAWVPEA